MMKNVEFIYGVFGDSLSEQALKQGFELQDGDKFEKIRKSINMCGFHVATDAQVESMIKKLHNQVMKNLVRVEE